MSLFAAVVVCLCACVGGERTPLYFSYITTRTGSFVASGAIPVVDLALEQINNRTDILANYSLGYTTILDSQCSDTASLDAFFEQFREDSRPTYVSLFCCGCSTAAISVAAISHYWNIPQMAGVAGANELNDREKFDGFYRTDASSEFVGAALAEMARQFNWTQMAIITQDESLFTMISESLNSIFTSEGKVLDTSIEIDKEAEIFPYHLLNSLAEGDYRIIVLNTGDSYAYAILCEAYYRGWFAPKYVWYTYSWYDNGWWDQDNGNSSCTPAIIRRMINDSLAITPNNNLVSDDRDTVTISGLTPEDYEVEYTNRLKQERYQALNLTEFIIAGSEYDAIWAMALGLNAASQRVEMKDSSGCEDFAGELVPLEDFYYLNDKMGCVLRKSFQQVSFRGITGPVQFNSNGSRDARVIRVQQYHVAGNGSVKRPTVAEVVININSSEVIFKANSGVASLWPDGVPYDGAARERLHMINTVLISLYAIAAIAGILYGIICLLFNIIFRNRKVVKLSSRNLNYLVVTGAVLLYASVYFYIFSGFDHHERAHEFICNFRQVSFSLGYTLCFAVILAKAWRVYYICININPKPKKIPKDWLLFVIVAVVVAGDLLIVLIGAAIPTSRINPDRVNDKQHPTAQEDGITYKHYVYVCLNDGAIVWLAVSYAYKGILQLVAMFMAFHIRRVKIKVLNDALETAVIIYVNSIILALLMVVEFALIRYHDIHAALFGLALIVGPTVFLSLIFVPQMVNLIKDPTGEKALDTSASTGISPTAKSVASSEVSKFADMQLRTTKVEERETMGTEPNNKDKGTKL